MKFSFKVSAAVEVFKTLTGIIESSSTLPVLQHVLVVVRDGVATLTASDLETQIVAKMPVEISEPGEWAIPGKKLAQIFQLLPFLAEATIKVKDNRATLTCGKSRFVLALLPSSEFPWVESISGGEVIEMQSAVLHKLMMAVHLGMAKNDVRYYLNGLMLETSHERLNAVATNGHFMGCAHAEITPSGGDPRQVIVPRKAVLEVIKLLAKFDGTVKVTLGTSHIQVDKPGLQFLTKLIDGRFPDHSRVMPTHAPNKLVVAKDALLDAIGRVGIISRDNTHQSIILSLGATDYFTLRATGGGVGGADTCEEEVTGDYKGEAFEVGCAAGYLMDAVKSIQSPVLALSFNGASSGFLVEPIGNDSARWVVMPMRI